MNINAAKLLSEIDDRYILESFPQYSDTVKDKKRRWKLFFCTAATFVILIVPLAVCVADPVFARNLPLAGRIFAYIQEALDVSGEYSSYATETGEKVYSNGIAVTMSECYCDGLNLYIAYEIVSDLPFDAYTDRSYSDNQLDYTMNAQICYEDQVFLPDSSGISGLEGEFVDQYTFAGVETLSLDGKEFPGSFDLKVSIMEIQLLTSPPELEIPISGYWEFCVPVETNTKDRKIVYPDAEAEGHIIDQVVISPVMITVYSSCPDIYGDTLDYGVYAFSDLREGDVGIQGCYGATGGVTRIPRKWVGSRLELFVADHSELDLVKARQDLKKEVQEHAVLNVTIDMQ